MRLLMRMLAGSSVLVVVWALSSPMPAAAQPRSDASAGLAPEYERHFDALKADNLEGHFHLAQWCRDKEAWELLRRQCVHVLSLDPNHGQAKLLLELANRQLKESPGRKDPTSKPGGAAGRGDSGLPRLATEAEIQRIRWMEFDDENEPRPLAVQFTKNVIDRFLAAMEGEQGFTSDDERRRFRLLSPNEKIRHMRLETADRFAEDVIIKSDPHRLADFERKVWPLVLGGCATSGCHGAITQNPFVLYTDAVMDKPKLYTNYLILHDYRVADRPLIDRNSPDHSLLLTYGLMELTATLEPSYRHPTEIKPVFRGPSDTRYQTIYDWIDSLSTIAPDYGISLSSPPANGGQTP